MEKIDPDLLKIEVEMVQPTLPRFTKEKLDEIPNEHLVELSHVMSEEDTSKMRKFLALLINERLTDYLADILAGFMPFGLGWLVKRGLDAILPKQFLAILYSLLDRIDGAREAS